jgi:hypothetical protein
MNETTRWGKQFIDMRDWKAYNEELVIRGEFYLDLDFVVNWKVELEEMNRNKSGARYLFPESLIQLQAVWHQFVDYRGIEGLTGKLVKLGLIPAVNDYSTIARRINKLEISFSMPEGGTCFVSCDGTGMKFENAGEYRERMYGKNRRKYLKVVITADPKTKKLLAIDASIEGEGLSEADTAIKHMNGFINQGINIIGSWNDGAFDKKAFFDFLDANLIESHVKIRRNAVVHGDNSLRDREVQKYKDDGYKKWAESKEYGLRWNGTEGIFSAVKRKFGERTRSTKPENALHEAKLKFWSYARMREHYLQWLF